jgi:phospholipid transport system substrate-binding protein
MVAAAVALLAVVGTPAVHAAQPLTAAQFVRTKIDEFADLIQSNKADRFTILRDRVRRIADFDGFAKQALASQWASASPGERQRFKDAMQALLESHYMSKPATIFDKEKITVEEATVSGEVTNVRSLVKRKDVDIEVLAKLKAGADTWRVEDVTIDGLSLLEDYRSQFQSFLKKKTLAQLITRLHERAEANMRGSADGDTHGAAK